MAMTYQQCWHRIALPADTLDAIATARPRALKPAVTPVAGTAVVGNAHSAAFAVTAFAVTRRRSATSPG